MHMEIWDAHVHLGLPYIDELRPDKKVFELGSCERLIADMDRNNITRSVIFPTASVGREYEKSNDEISTCVKRSPNKFIGFARVNPRLGAIAVKEVKRAATRLGLKGLKLHPEIEAFRPDHEVHKPLFETATKLGLVILIHSSPCGRAPVYSSPFYIERVAQSFPKLKIILAHLNEDSLIVMERNPNLYADTAITPHTTTIRHAVEVGFEDRVCFGSDWPYGSGSKFEAWKVEEAVPEESTREKIFYKNLKGILE